MLVIGVASTILDTNSTVAKSHVIIRFIHNGSMYHEIIILHNCQNLTQLILQFRASNILWQT